MTTFSLDSPSPEIYFILGGARSGKSTFAEQLAHRRAGDDVLFIATAEALDDEMRVRIAKHRADRPAAWQTLEAPRDLISALARLETIPRLVILDCLTLWLTNELLADETDLERRLTRELDLVTEWARIKSIDLVIVSNEVGLGIVPDNALSRTFRDVLGRLNAGAARHADFVFWMVAGLPVEVKTRAVSLG